MPHELSLVLRIAHIIGAAMWFAIPLLLAGDIRRTLAKAEDKDHARWLIDRAERSIKMVLMGAGLAILSGLGLIFAKGGFGAVSGNIHIGFLVSLLLLALNLLGTRPAWKKIAAVITSEAPLSEAAGAAKRFAAFTGVAHLLWLVIISLMVFA